MERLSWQERVKKSKHPSLRGFFPIKERLFFIIFQVEADGLNPAGQQQSTDDSEVGNDFLEDFSELHLSSSCSTTGQTLCAPKGSFPIALKYIDSSGIWDKCYCRTGSTPSERWHFSDTSAVQSRRKMVVFFHGMSVLPAKRSRLLVGRENSLRQAMWRTIQWDNNSFRIDGGISHDFSERPEPTPSIWL